MYEYNSTCSFINKDSAAIAIKSSKYLLIRLLIHTTSSNLLLMEKLAQPYYSHAVLESPAKSAKGTVKKADSSHMKKEVTQQFATRIQD